MGESRKDKRRRLATKAKSRKPIRKKPRDDGGVNFFAVIDRARDLRPKNENALTRH